MDIFEKSILASKFLRTASTSLKNEVIAIVSKALLENSKKIISANEEDVKEQIALNTKSSMIDRLRLDEKRLQAVCQDMLKVALLPDPVGEVISKNVTANGLDIRKVAVPYGVIGIIYEARPNVTVDVFTLCLKTGNACLLKGGKDARRTNEAVVETIRQALLSTPIPQDAVILMPSERSSAEELIKARGKVDLIVPRGSKNLIDYVVKNSLVPVIETGAGVCHTYVEKTADLDQAFEILENAKMSRPSVCNACETLLVDKEIAKDFIKKIQSNISNLRLRSDDEFVKDLGLLPMTELGFAMEYGDFDLSVKTVDGVKEAVEHINKFGTHHSDCICTKDKDCENYFMANVDSACVYANSSTRFSDGGCFGFGAELGISTQKTPPRGPMGLKEMTTYQYRVFGNGQIRK